MTWRPRVAEPGRDRARAAEWTGVGLLADGGGSGRLGRSSPGRGGPVQTRRIDVPAAERQALAPEARGHTLSAEEGRRAEEADPRYGLSSAEAASRAGRF